MNKSIWALLCCALPAVTLAFSPGVAITKTPMRMVAEQQRDQGRVEVSRGGFLST